MQFIKELHTESGLFCNDYYYYNPFEKTSDYGEVLTMLVNNGFKINGLTINFENDHSTMNLPKSFKNIEDLTKDLANYELEDIESIRIGCEYNDAHASVTLLNGCMRVSRVR